MASRLTRFGNDLYTGERSVPFIRLRWIWLTIAAALMLVAVAVPFVRGGGDFGAGFNFGASVWSWHMPKRAPKGGGS